VDRPVAVAERIRSVSLRKSYGETAVLSGLNLEVGPGKTLAIIGRSGSGKSTLLRCLATLEPFAHGCLELDGQKYYQDGTAIYEPWEIRRSVVMVLQEASLFPNFTVQGNIALPLVKVRGLSRRDADARAAELATELGIENVLSRYPLGLSGGQAQRCALARAMVLRPKVLLLDEITAGLDPETTVDVAAAIRRLRTLEGTEDLTIVLVTHLMRFAEHFADRIAFLHDGAILEELPAPDFFASCKHPETRRFVTPFLDGQ